MSNPSSTERAAPTRAVRAQLIAALKLDLVGPSADHPLAAEQLADTLRPANWYLTGFLIPSGTPAEQNSDPDEDDEPEEVPAQAGLDQETNDDRRSAKKGFFPASIGLTFLVSAKTRELTVTLRWGDYGLTPLPATGEPPTQVWQRTQREESLVVPLTGGAQGPYHVRDSHGLQYQLIERPITLPRRTLPLPPGTRSVSVYLVNRRPPVEDPPDPAYAFQAEIEVRSAMPFVPRPNLSGAPSGEWDGMVADLHYANIPEYAVGHGISAEWELHDGDCRLLRTAWIPSAEVEKTVTVDLPGVELRMETLGNLADGAAAELALRPLVSAYRAWLGVQQVAAEQHAGQRGDTAKQLVKHAALAATRIERGINDSHNFRCNCGSYLFMAICSCDALHLPGTYQKPIAVIAQPYLLYTCAAAPAGGRPIGVHVRVATLTAFVGGFCAYTCTPTQA